MIFVKPQLAKTATDRSIEALGGSYVMEIKLDGHRRLMGRDVAWSRIGKDHSHPDIQSQIPEGWLFDGEIVPVDCDASSNVVSHYLSECPEKLKFVAFDVLWTAGQDIQGQDWAFRRAVLEGFFSTRTGLERFEMSKVYYPRTTPLEEVIEMAANDDHEGVMLKKYLAPYKPNSRSAWQKYKFIETYDVVITDCDSKPSEWRVRPGETGKDGIHYPDGRHSDPWIAGHVGLSYGMYDKDGTLRRIGSLGVTGQREDMSKYVGMVAEVKSYGPQYPTGALRHPVVLGWREDKCATDCVFDFNQ